MGMRAGSSLMKAASGSSSTAGGSQGKQLRLVDCPRCGVRVIKITSRQAATLGEVFFKCPNNIKEDPRTCGFIRSVEQYETYLRNLDAQKDGYVEHYVRGFGDEKQEFRQEIKELKQQVGNMKQQLDMALGEIWSLKMQSCEIKQQKKAFGLDNGVAVAICVGVMLGLLVSAMWK